MTLPNFLIIGTGKSGTSSLYYYLKQHPEIFMSPVKEPNFFAYDPNHKGWNGPMPNLEESITSLSEYMKLYDNVQNEKAIGEASPSNFGAWACDQIRRYVPHARLVCILRQPVDAGYSAFLHRRRDGHEPESDFLKAYRSTDWRKNQHWAPMLYYRRLYSLALKNWLSHFPRDRFRFYLTDDLKKDPTLLMRDLYRFLEVDDGFIPELSPRNAAYQTRMHSLRRLLSATHKEPPLAGVLRRFVPRPLRRPLRKRLIQWNKVSAPPLNPQIRNELTRELRNEILCVQDLIGRDLSHWLMER